MNFFEEGAGGTLKVISAVIGCVWNITKEYEKKHGLAIFDMGGGGTVLILTTYVVCGGGGRCSYYMQWPIKLNLTQLSV